MKESYTVLLQRDLCKGQAFAGAGKQVGSSASYGPEVRGGCTRSEVIVSDEMIVYPRVMSPNILMALSQEAYDRVCDVVPAEGLILYKSDAVTADLELDAAQRAVPALGAAADLGDAGSANMVMRGAVAAGAGLIDLDALTRALPDSRRAANAAALVRGFALGLAAPT